MPPRTIEVHDSKVRRIPSITPDMIYPNRRSHESNDNILKRSRRVRVQTVNVNRAAK